MELVAKKFESRCNAEERSGFMGQGLAFRFSLLGLRVKTRLGVKGSRFAVYCLGA